MLPFKYGFVYNINPAVETIFQLFGQRTSMRQLKVVFNIYDEYPGNGPIVEEDGWHSMDLPNLMEKFRMMYVCKPGFSEPLVDVLWKGDCRPLIWPKQYETKFLDHLQNIVDHGWEIDIQPLMDAISKDIPSLMDATSKYIQPLIRSISKLTPDEFTNIPLYTLRRTKLHEPLMGDDPNPYSGLYMSVEEALLGEVTR